MLGKKKQLIILRNETMNVKQQKERHTGTHPAAEGLVSWFVVELPPLRFYVKDPH